MSIFKGEDTKQDITSSGIRKQSSIKLMASAVKANVTIPMYFYSIVLPQLGDYYDNYPVDFSVDPRACCCLHDEDTPSFRYYEDTNSFYCFGCGKGGDVINLHMYFAEKINGKRPTRDEAVSFLYQYFVQGHESNTFINTSTQSLDKPEKLNEDKDIVKFNLYRFNLEQSITFDKTLKLEVKEQLWEILDNVDMLLSKNIIKVNSAERYIKQKVRELITVEATSPTTKLIKF